MDDVCQRLASDVDTTFPEVVAALQDGLYSGLRRLQPNDAEDLTQEAFIRAYRALKSYEPKQIRALDLRAWMWTIALNVGRNSARDRTRRPIPATLHDRHVAVDAEVPDVDEWDRRLGCLSPMQRKTVVLRHVVGFSIAEISELLERPVGTVKADLHRSMKKLRTAIEEESA